MLRSYSRRIARFALGPFWRRVWFRIDQRLAAQDTRIDAFERQVSRIDASCAQIQAYVPSLVGYIAVAKQFTSGIDELSNRIDELATRLRDIEAEVKALDERIGTTPVDGSNHLTGFIDAQIYSVKRSIDDQEERMNGIRRALSQNIDDLWQFTKSKSPLPTENRDG